MYMYIFHFILQAAWASISLLGGENVLRDTASRDLCMTPVSQELYELLLQDNFPGQICDNGLECHVSQKYWWCQCEIPILFCSFHVIITSY